MAVRLITYDLNKTGQNYTKLLEVIRSYGAWARLSESSYAIVTNEFVEVTYNKLKPYFDPNDNLLILTLAGAHIGQNSQEVVDWLRNNL